MTSLVLRWCLKCEKTWPHINICNDNFESKTKRHQQANCFKIAVYQGSELLMFDDAKKYDTGM